MELPPTPEGPFGTINLGPGGLYELNPSREFPVTAAEFAAVESGSLAIYVMAWVSYKDATGEQHLERVALESMFRADGVVFKAARIANA
ncbi:hypothetical protein [Brevundimonas sp.]|uniref:hypothetical protein n=1 Tax=Brevundimonas sp. TaxID=1871086 RepID=UPI002FC63398